MPLTTFTPGKARGPRRSTPRSRDTVPVAAPRGGQDRVWVTLSV